MIALLFQSALFGSRSVVVDPSNACAVQCELCVSLIAPVPLMLVCKSRPWSATTFGRFNIYTIVEICIKCLFKDALPFME